METGSYLRSRSSISSWYERHQRQRQLLQRKQMCSLIIALFRTISSNIWQLTLGPSFSTNSSLWSRSSILSRYGRHKRQENLLQTKQMCFLNIALFRTISPNIWLLTPDPSFSTNSWHVIRASQSQKVENDGILSPRKCTSGTLQPNHHICSQHYISQHQKHCDAIVKPSI